MATRRIFNDALVVGSLWGLIEVACTFLLGLAPPGDFPAIFLAPLALSLSYHTPLWVVSRFRPHRVVDGLLSIGLLLPPVIFWYRAGGWEVRLMPVSLLPMLLAFLLVVREFRKPDVRGWLTPFRLFAAFLIYAGAAAVFARRTTLGTGGLWTIVLNLTPWLSASALVLVAVAAWARRWGGPAVLAAACLCALTLAVHRGSPPPVYLPEPPGKAPPSPARTDAPNVLLIVLDTVRADHLDLYGYPRPTLARTSRYLRDGLVFDRATSSGTFSLTSHGSLFTGLLPSAHGAHPKFSARQARREHTRLWDDVPTLAEELSRRGYHTAGVAANSYYLAEWTGFQRGFATFQASERRRGRFRAISSRVRQRLPAAFFGEPTAKATWTAKEVSDAAIAIATRTQNPFFLFLNYFDAHGPHEVIGTPPWTTPKDASPIDKYDSEIASMDAELARLLGSLEARGLLDDTLVIFTADHGEYFGEKNLSGHPGESYEGSTHIPLALRLKGVVPQGRSTRRTALHEVFRMTLDVVDQRPLDWLNQVDSTPRILNEAWQRKDYRKLSHPGDGPTATVVFAGNLKLIHRLAGGSELFDLDNDPAEERNLIDSEDPGIAGVREQMIEEVLKRPPRAAGPSVPLPPEAEERLRALGYLR